MSNNTTTETTMTTRFESEHQGETSIHDTIEQAIAWIEGAAGYSVLGEWHPIVDPDGAELQRVCSYDTAEAAEIDDTSTTETCITEIAGEETPNISIVGGPAVDPGDPEATNVDVSVEIRGEVTYGHVTLWADPANDGEYGTCGLPLEVWCGSNLHNFDRDVLTAIELAAATAIEQGV